MYCLRDGKIYKVEHLRGRLYIREGLPYEERDGKRYALTPAAEWLCTVYKTIEEAEAVRKERKARKAKALAKEQKEYERMMAEREPLISRLVTAAAALDIELCGVGFWTNDEIEREARRLEAIARARGL